MKIPLPTLLALLTLTAGPLLGEDGFKPLFNGKVTSELFDYDEKGRALEGLLAIQLHSGNTNTVQVKQIELRPLTDGKVLPFEPSRLPAGATRIEAPRSTRPQGVGPVTPAKK